MSSQLGAFYAHPNPGDTFVFSKRQLGELHLLLISCENDLFPVISRLGVKYCSKLVFDGMVDSTVNGGTFLIDYCNRRIPSSLRLRNLVKEIGPCYLQKINHSNGL